MDFLTVNFFKSLDRSKLFLVMTTVLIVVALDQWTKQLAIKYLMGAETINYFNGVFQLVYAENPGAFLGMGGALSRPIRFVVFGLVVAIGLGLMFWSILKNKVGQIEAFAYSLILAGGIGNVIDRLSHERGHVVDFMFIDLKFAPFAKTGVFNIADVAIVFGVIVLLFFTKHQDAKLK